MGYKLGVFIRQQEDWKDRNVTWEVAKHLLQKDDLEIFLIDYCHPDNAPLFEGDLSHVFRAVQITNPDNFGNLPAPNKDLTIDDFDFLWLRIGPPTPMAFFTALREKDKQTTPIILNNPAGILELDNKSFLPSLKDSLGEFLPAMKVCKTIEDVEAFAQEYPDMVLKDVDSNAAKGVARYKQNGETDLKTHDDVKAFMDAAKGTLAMEWLENDQQSDNRIIVVNGKTYCSVARTPQPGDWLCNIASGGSFVQTELTDQEQKIIDRLTPLFDEKGAFFVGLDTLLDKDGNRRLSEINCINVGTIGLVDRRDNTNFCVELANDLYSAFKAKLGG